MSRFRVSYVRTNTETQTRYGAGTRRGLDKLYSPSRWAVLGAARISWAGKREPIIFFIL
jgi:hypothetical protein